jgi:tetrapyrrole methylase family protein/MazG family protein
MTTITIVGLGPGDSSLLTRAAWELLQASTVVYLRTAVHPTVAELPTTLELRAFDALYEAAPDFGVVYERIASELIERARGGEQVVYAVPGHPLIAEATTRRLLALAHEQHIPTRIIPGLSFVEPVCSALQLDPLEHGLQLLDALDLVLPESGAARNAKRATPTPDGAWSEIQGIGPYTPALLPFPLLPTRPALICQLYSRQVASHVKLSLMERYPADHPIGLVRAAGVALAEHVWSVPLHELDHQHELDYLTCAYVPPIAVLDDRRGPEGVTAIVARLLGPGGCPWDREQTHRSLRADLLEETHEVLEALDAEDMDALAEELGDLLLHIMMHSEMARQAGEFDLGVVYDQIATKLIRRHPHIFDELNVAGSDEVLRNWEAIKRAERGDKGQAPRGLLDGIPKSMPALTSAQELTRKAAKVAPDWPDRQAVWDKLHEALAELRDAGTHERRVEHTLGELLFAVTNLARWLDIDAENALRMANNRFRQRFASLDALAHAQGCDLLALSAAEKAALWEQAKAQEP